MKPPVPTVAFHIIGISRDCQVIHNAAPIDHRSHLTSDNPKPVDRVFVRLFEFNQRAMQEAGKLTGSCWVDSVFILRLSRDVSNV